MEQDAGRGRGACRVGICSGSSRAGTQDSRGLSEWAGLDFTQKAVGASSSLP